MKKTAIVLLVILLMGFLISSDVDAGTALALAYTSGDAINPEAMFVNNESCSSDSSTRFSSDYTYYELDDIYRIVGSRNRMQGPSIVVEYSVDGVIWSALTNMQSPSACSDSVDSHNIVAKYFRFKAPIDVSYLDYFELIGRSMDECQYMVRELDLYADGTITDGGVDALPGTRDGQQLYSFDVTYQIDVTNLREGTFSAAVYFTVSDPAELIEYDKITADSEYGINAVINGRTYTLYNLSGGDAASIFELTGPAEDNTLTVRLYGDLPGETYTGDTIALSSLTVTANFADGCAYNILYDGGMEQFRYSDYWYPDGTWNRANTGHTSLLELWYNGQPACEKGHQILRKAGAPGEPGHPVHQQFYWPGGDMTWKVRAKASGYSPWVYLSDTAGSVLYNLLGDSSVYSPYQTIDWAYYTGTVTDVEPGVYNLALSRSTAENVALFTYVMYDDVAIAPPGADVYAGCDVMYEEPPIVEATPTPTPTGQVTPSPTSTTQFLSTFTRTPTNAPTLPKTHTPTARPTRTPTPGPSPTLMGGPTVTSVIASRTPTVSRTPYGTPGDGGGEYTPTGTLTPGNTKTPGAPIGDMPPDNGTRVPGGDGPGGPGEDVDGYCSRPVNPWSIAWWIDYEFCRLEWAVSLHPYHAVTMAAVPTRYATYAIMRQANEMQQELNQVKTEVAVYDFDTVTIGSQPDSETFQPDSSSPWNGGRWSLHSDQSMPMSYTGYCSAAIRDVVGTRVMDGFCFALNVMREKKLLWIFQAVINVVSIAIIGDSIAKILRVRAKGE